MNTVRRQIYKDVIFRRYRKKKFKNGEKYTIGELYKDEIFEFISQHRDGAFPHEIAKKIQSKPSRETIHTHLRELIKEKKIFQEKRNGRYFATEPDIVDIINFTDCMKRACSSITWTNLKGVPATNSHNNLNESIHHTAASKVLCDTKFSNDTVNEKFFFDFANRIGAYIIYIFIEAIRPVDEFNIMHSGLHPKQKAENKDSRVKRGWIRNILSRRLIHNAIDPIVFFEAFCYILRFSSPRLTKLGYDKYTTDDNPFFELEKEDFDRISNTFKKVYPGIYERLENSWPDHMQSYIDWLEYKEREQGLRCQHRWRETYIYKLGKHYYCLRCGNVVSDTFMKMKGMTANDN